MGLCLQDWRMTTLIEALKYLSKYFKCEDGSTATRLRFWSATEFYLYLRLTTDCSFITFNKTIYFIGTLG